MAEKKGKSSQETEKHLIKKEEYVNLDFFGKLKDLYFKPQKFLKRIENEKFYVSFRWFMFFYISYILVSIIISLAQKQANIYVVLVSLIYTVFIAIIVVFLLSYVVYLIGKLFRVKKDYFHSFKPVAYTLVIWVVYSYISLIFYYLIPFDNSMLQILQISQDSAVIKQAYILFLSQPGAIINSLILIITLVHMIIFNSKGIEKFQEISKGKSFALVIVSWVVFIAILAGLLILIYLAAGT